MNIRFTAIGAMLLGLLVIAGCTTPPTLYYWGDYQNQVHDYLLAGNGGDTQKQISSLESGVEAAKASGKPLPPGYHAQLGMLYYAQGKPDLAVEQLQIEKLTYPESTSYINRLLAKFKKS